MPDETKFSGVPPIFPPNLKPAAYRPLYTQTSNRVPDPTIPLTPIGGEGVNQHDTSNPLAKDGRVTTTVATGNCNDNSRAEVASLGLPKNGTGGSDQLANHDSKASFNPFSPGQTQKYTSPLLSDSD